MLAHVGFLNERKRKKKKCTEGEKKQTTDSVKMDY